METLNQPSEYLKFYKFLPVLTAEQIRKLGRVATGILQLNVFSNEEIRQLESEIEVNSGTASSKYSKDPQGLNGERY